MSLLQAHAMCAKKIEEAPAGIVSTLRRKQGTIKLVDYAKYFIPFYVENYKDPIVKGKETLSRINKYIAPTLPFLPIHLLDDQNIKKILDHTKEQGGPAVAIHVRLFLRQMCKQAIIEGHLSTNPVESVPSRKIHRLVSRRRVLTKEEIRAVLNMPCEDYIKWSIELLLLTMMRKNELLKAQWGWVYWDRKMIQVPTANSKKKQPHNVFLTERALTLLKLLKERAAQSPWVVVSSWSSEKPLSHARLNQIIKKINFDITVHDFRRTAATLLAEEGHEPLIIEKALNHKVPGLIGIYNRAGYISQREKLLEHWASMVHSIKTGDRGELSQPASTS